MMTVVALIATAFALSPLGSNAQTIEPTEIATDAAVAQEPAEPDGTGDGVTVVSPAAGSSRQQALRSAFDLYQTGERGRAFQRIVRYATIHPDDRTIAVRFARLLTEQNDFDGAIAFLRDFLELHPGYHSTSLELGSLLLAYLEHEEAATVLQRIPPSDSLTSRLGRLNLGKSFRALGRFEDARRVYQSIVGGATAAFTLAALCEIDLAVGEINACRTKLERADDSARNHGALLQTTAIMAYLEGEYGQALHDLSMLQSFGEAGTRALALHVLVPLAQGDSDAAEEGMNELRQETVKGERYLLSALVRYAAGHNRRAVSAYQIAVERNSLFANPNLTQRILIWRPELTESLRALAAEARDSGETASSPQAGAPDDSTSEGCCSVARSPTSQPALLLVGLAAVAFCWRRRQRGC